MNKNFKINLKICGITSVSSIKLAAENDVKSLGFASNNLLGPNTCNDDEIKNLIEECNYYKIESVLLTRHQTLKKLINQIDYTKPKIVSCSYFFIKKDLKSIKSIFKKLKIGISINPIKFDKNYLESVKNLIDVLYYDLNVYSDNKISTYSLNDCLDHIKFLKKLKIPIYVGGGVNNENAKNIINLISPNGLDISRGLKDINNNISKLKLNKLQMSLSAA